MGRISASGQPSRGASSTQQNPVLWERRLAGAGLRIVRFGEIFVVAAAGLLVLTAIFLAAVTLFELVFVGVQRNLGSIESIGALQEGVQSVFAGVLLLMLGLELLETLKSYFVDSEIRIEVILVVALIAVSRHVMVIDVEHSSGIVLIGSAALTVALAASYWLVRSRRAKRVGAPAG